MATRKGPTGRKATAAKKAASTAKKAASKATARRKLTARKPAVGPKRVPSKATVRGKVSRTDLKIRRQKVRFLLEVDGEIIARPDNEGVFLRVPLLATVTRICPSHLNASLCIPAACHFVLPGTERVEITPRIARKARVGAKIPGSPPVDADTPTVVIMDRKLVKKAFKP